MKFANYYFLATRGLDLHFVASGMTTASSENEAVRNARKKYPKADRYFVELMPATQLQRWAVSLIRAEQQA